MITIWRYLISSYLKVFILAVSTFIALLLITRLEEIAYFISLGTKASTILLFIGYQIPFILPIAIAIASLLATLTLFYRLSTTQELTTLRFSGLSLRFIAAPLLIVAALFSCASFCLCSEYATTSHLKTRKMVYELTSTNPLLLLSHARIPKLNSAYIQMDPTYQGKSAKNLLIAFFNNKASCINYILAEEMIVDNKELIVNNVSLVSALPKEQALIIENHSQIKSSAIELSHILRSKGWKIANDHLNLRLLRIRKKEFKQQLKEAEQPYKKKYYKKKIQKCDSEIIRRISLGITPFTFTLMGIALGIHISRRQSKKRFFVAALLTVGTLIAFFTAKELSYLFYTATILFLLPHLVVVLISLYSLSNVKRGIE